MLRNDGQVSAEGVRIKIDKIDDWITIAKNNEDGNLVELYNVLKKSSFTLMPKQELYFEVFYKGRGYKEFLLTSPVKVIAYTNNNEREKMVAIITYNLNMFDYAQEDSIQLQLQDLVNSIDEGNRNTYRGPYGR